MSTPKLTLRTRFVFDEDGRIVSTREPGPGRGPAFILVRGAESCAWAIHRDVAPEIAEELESLAREEPPISDLRTPPVHVERYVALVGGELGSGPAFTFPEEITQLGETEIVDELWQLESHFTSWTADEVPDASPIVAVFEGAHAVSVCFCATRAAAWALAMRASGRTPLYSTSWSNDASRAVARKLGLIPYATTWNLSGKSRPGAYP